MKKKLVILFGIAVLTAMPAAYASAQPMEGPGDEENEAFQNDQRGPGGQVNKEIVVKHRGGMDEGQGMRGPGGMEEGRGMKGGGPGFVNEDEVMAGIKKYDPAFAAKLAELKTMAPPKYKMVLMMSGKALGMAKMAGDESIARDAVHTVAIEYETKELSMKYDKAADPDKAGIKADLKAKVSELFDLRLKGQEFRVKMMEKELAKLKKNLETRKASKAKLVDERVGQMTGENPGW